MHAQTQASVAAVFPGHDAAEAAVKALTAAGVPLRSISIVGNGYHTGEKVLGFYNMGDRVKFWGSRGAFWALSSDKWLAASGWPDLLQPARSLLMSEQHPDVIQHIRERAYTLWQQDGCPEGRADQHWQRACDEHAAAEHMVDVEEEDSFPASDPPSRSVVTGVR